VVSGFAVIKDVPKTMAYKLARYRNSLAGSQLITSTLTDKQLSAEPRAEIEGCPLPTGSKDDNTLNNKYPGMKK